MKNNKPDKEFDDKLVTLLKTDERFVDEDGHLIKNVVADKAREFDSALIELLFCSDIFRKKFFQQIKKSWVFNVALFVYFVMDKHFLNDSHTKFGNKMGLTLGGKRLKQHDDVALIWPFKDCVLEGGMKDEGKGRKEIFFNEVLAEDEIDRLLHPKVLTKGKRFSHGKKQSGNKLKLTRDESGLIQDNLIIKGNNLLAMHSIKKEFAGKIKLIYIDPPYNTNNDGFKYNDNFTHATWMTFMKNRLEVAKELLRDDGLIFVECDDNEQAYLKVLMDWVFGRDNFINCIAVKSSSPSGVKVSHANKKILKSKDYILVFKKIHINLKPQYILKKSWDTHYSFFVDEADGKIEIKPLVEKINELKLFSIKNMKEFDIENKEHKKFYLKYGDFICRESSHSNKEIQEMCNKQPGEVLKIKNNWYINNRMLQPISKSFHYGLKGHAIEKDIANLLCDFWDDIDFQNTQNQGGVSLKNGKKPESLLYRIIDMVTQPGDIVLDYHLGSGTTAAVAHKMGRRYVGIEQMNYIEDIAVERLKKVIEGEQGGISKAINWQGGGEFVYLELKKHNEEFVDRIQSAKTTAALKEIWKEMKDKSFLNLDAEVEKIDKKIAKWKESDSKSDQREELTTYLDKNQLYVNFSEIDDEDFGCTDDEKQLSNQFYREVD